MKILIKLVSMVLLFIISSSSQASAVKTCATRAVLSAAFGAYAHCVVTINGQRVPKSELPRLDTKEKCEKYCEDLKKNKYSQSNDTSENYLSDDYDIPANPAGI